MAFATYFFFGAVLCMAHANPLGQTTVCESTPNHYLPLPGVGSTTVCESSPNLLGYAWPPASPYLPQVGYFPYHYPYGSTTVHESGVLGVPSTTVCETVPNMLPVAPAVLPFYPQPIPKASTTVCETVPNVLPYSYPYSYPYQINPAVGSTTVCESAANVLPYGSLPYPGLLPALGRTLL